MPASPRQTSYAFPGRGLETKPHTHGPSPYIPDIISTQKGDKVNAETSASHIHFYKIINKCYFTPLVG